VLTKYIAFARASWALTLEYRAQILIWMTSSLLMLIMMMVWITVSQDGAVNGMDTGDFVSYYMVGWFIRTVTAVWASWELDFAIREGRLSPLLLRPIHPIHNEIAANWTEKVLRLLIALPISAGVLWVVPAATLQLQPVNIALFVVSLLLAWVIVFLSDYLVGMLAFWTTQTSAFILMFYGVRMLLSGIIAPLSMMPLWAQTVLLWTPFPYMLNFPTLLVTADVPRDQLVFGFAVQIFWALFFFGAVRLTWRVAMRSYSAVGA
jgi:ABC-2 type transport system permease protein